MLIEFIGFSVIKYIKHPFCIRWRNHALTEGTHNLFGSFNIDLDIESNYGLCYDSSEDKHEAQKEITQIKRFLLECVDAGCVQCFPGWCTGYASEERTLAGINEAVKAMREEVRLTPTWWTCERKGIEV